jgi:3-isopropylmalate dehydrogenase
MMKKKNYNIGVLPGDGVGPECIREGLKVLKESCAKEGITLNLVNYDFGAERYLKTGELLPDSAIEEFRKLDAIYLGAVGDPRVKPGVIEKDLLLKLRFSLDQYINLRPVKLFPGVWTPLRDKTPEQIDFVIIRENTESLYVGIGGFFKKGTPDEVATQIDLNTRKGVERCIRYSFEFCRKRHKQFPGKGSEAVLGEAKGKKLIMVDKSNVLTYGHDLWVRVFDEVGREYTDVEKGHAYVDATCMWMVKNPEWFDVIVTNNMFGDIITDLGAMIQGGLGVAAGGNINPEGVSMFEPIHGSAPKYTGKNVINPIATILAGAMMMDTLGETGAANRIEKAVRDVLASGRFKSMDADKMGMSTSEVGDFIAESVGG